MQEDHDTAQGDAEVSIDSAAALLQVPKGADETLDAIVSRLLEGRVVPFLGAGASYASAKDVYGFDFQFHQPDPLFSSLASAFEAFDPPPEQWLRESFKKYLTSPRRLGEACEVWLAARPEDEPELPANALCWALEIRQFQRLAPTRAHRHLAFLACEGLLSEILTTNYDCAAEHAYAEAIGSRFPTHALVGPIEIDPAGLHVSFDLDSYRRQGRGVREPRRFEPTPSLRVHKLNGCARALARDGDHAEFVLLTERQLQGFRDRGWSRDLVRDRLRSSVVVFSGFGNDEPQIRHTVGLVMEEFGREPGGGPPTSAGSAGPGAAERGVRAGMGGVRADVHPVAGDERGRGGRRSSEGLEAAFRRAARGPRVRVRAEGPPKGTVPRRLLGGGRRSRAAPAPAPCLPRPRQPGRPRARPVRGVCGCARCAHRLSARTPERPRAGPQPARMGGGGDAPLLQNPARGAVARDAVPSRPLSSARHPRGAPRPPPRCRGVARVGATARRRLHPSVVLRRWGASSREGEAPVRLADLGNTPTPRSSDGTKVPTRSLGPVETEFVVDPRGRVPYCGIRSTSAGRILAVSVPDLLASHRATTSGVDGVDRLLRHTACFPTDALRAQERGFRRTFNPVPPRS